MEMEEHDLIASLLIWVHVTFVIVYIIGLVGSFITNFQAARESDVNSVNSLIKLEYIFKKYFESPGIDLLFIAGIFTAWREHVPMLGFIQGGEENWLLLSIFLIISTYPLMFMVYRPKEKVFKEELEAAIVKGKVTQGLKNAFSSKGLKRARFYELGVTAIILFLMIVKPL